MSFVQMFFFCLIFMWEGSWAVDVEAEEGAELEIKCSHSNAQGNVKYFCKDPCNDRDVLITSKRKDNKYSIRDNGNTFYVTISDVTSDDSGAYWCGVDRVGKDTYNYVLITVTQNDSRFNASLQNKAANKKLLYIGVGLGALLLILLTAVATFIAHRHRDICKPTDDVTYTDPFKYAQKPCQDTTACSSAHQSSVPSTAENNRAITHKPTCDIYANVETESVCYSSLLFSEIKVDTAPTVTPECTVYSEVKT